MGLATTTVGYELAKAFQSRVAALCCLAVVVLALVLPKDGPGLPLCQFKVVTRLPCLGCGLTRSFIGMAHLRFEDALFFHPLGLILFPLVLFIAVTGILPQGTRKSLAAWAERRNAVLNKGGWVVLIGAMAYGLVRIGWVMVTPGKPSPW